MSKAKAVDLMARMAKDLKVEGFRSKGKRSNRDNESPLVAGLFKNGRKPKRVSVHCDQCSMLSINGVACHETGCPNQNSRWDAESESWIKQRKCFECGCTVDADSPCCNYDDMGFEEEIETDPDEDTEDADDFDEAEE